MDRVNIIIAHYNGKKYIGELIDSIQNNSYKNIRITICDDGSNQDSLECLEEYRKKYPDTIEVHKNTSNRGVILNYLEAVKRCEDDYIMFCDQDDVWLPDKIEITLNAMKKAEKDSSKRVPTAVFTDAKVVDADLNVLNSSFFGSSGMNPDKHSLGELLMENKLIGCTVMINSETKRMLRPLPKHARMHDWWIGLICESFGRIVYVNKPTLLYRQHEDNVIGNQSFLTYFFNRISNLKKQKAALLDIEKQAAEFYSIYKGILRESDKKLVYQLASLNKYGWIKRRIIILKNGYLKSGIIRNIGILLLV